MIKHMWESVCGTLCPADWKRDSNSTFHFDRLCLNFMAQGQCHLSHEGMSYTLSITQETTGLMISDICVAYHANWPNGN